MKRRTQFACAAGLALAFLVVPAFAGTATTANAETGTPTREATPAYTEISFNGMMIAIDPETGHLRPPTEEEARELQQTMESMFSEVTRHNGAAAPAGFSSEGRMSRVLGQEHLNFEMLHLDADGRQARHCVNGVEAASRALAAPLDLTPAREER